MAGRSSTGECAVVDDEPRRSDERKPGPSLLDLALINSVMALVALVALAIYGSQVSVILSVGSGGV